MANCYSNIDLNTNKITNLATPSADTDAATKLTASTAPQHCIECSNTVSGGTSTNLNSATAVVAELTGTSTIVGSSFSVSGNGIQCDFTGVALFTVNIHTTSAGSQIICRFRLQRTRSAVTTDIGPFSLCGIMRGTTGIYEGSCHITDIQSVENGDLFEVTSIQYSAFTTAAYLTAAGTSNFVALRIG